MKHLLYTIVTLFLGSCSGTSKIDPAPIEPPFASEITVDKPELNLSAEATSQTVTIASNAPWQIVGTNDWINVTPSSGTAGKTEVKLNLTQNTQYAQRNATLTVMTTNKSTRASSQVIIVRQAEPGALILASKDTTVVRHSSNLSVKLLTNLDYTIEDDAQWITQQQTKALRPETVIFAINENPTTEPRIGTITFRSEGVTDKITVRQSPNGISLEQQTRAWDGVRRGDIFYEIFVRSFADSNGDGIGDLNGISDKLDYLESLGITGLWLTPINPSPSYHGYDVTDYEAVNSQFGTLVDFDNLVAKASAKGIKIVLDFVINHTSNRHPWFLEAIKSTTATTRNYYTFESSSEAQVNCTAGSVAMVDDNKYVSGYWKNVSGTTDLYYGMFSDQMPDLNYGRAPKLNPVYNKILDAARFWMNRGVYGLRLDAVKHIYQNERGEENIKFLKRFYDDLRADYPNIYMIGEVLSGTDDSKEFLRAIPSVFHFDSWWKLDDALGKSTGKYYAKDMAEAMQKFGNANVGTKLSNHDEDRAMSKLSMSGNKARIAFAAIMTTPGQPYIYYGEELGMYGMKTSGDENVRQPLPWGDSYTTTWMTTAPLATVSEQAADSESLLNFYREFTRLRNTYPSLASGTMSYADNQQTPNELMVLTRALGSERLMVVANFSNKEIEYNLPETAQNVVKAHNGARMLKFTDGTFIGQMKPYSILIIEI